MKKKNWSNPELKSSDAINTHETECTCGAVINGDISTFKASKHPCHKTGNGEHNDSGNHNQGVEQNGHVLSVGCTNPSHYDAQGNPMCCCFKAASVGGMS